MVKGFAAVISLTTATVVAIPLFAIGGGAGPASLGCGPLPVILDTIRRVESGGNYQAVSATSSASGAYQFIDATWRQYADRAGVDTARYPHAHLAPPVDQDDAATVAVTQILTDHNGDITVVPLAWYLPAAIDNPALMDRMPTGGNTLTPRQYQTRWLQMYDTKLTQQQPATAPNAACSAGAPTVGGGRWALPARRDLIAVDTLDDPHHDYPAWDLLVPQGTPIYAIAAGTVTTIQHWDGNWWNAGCDGLDAPEGCNTCGNGITIQTGSGLRHTYCHNRRLHVTVGDTVTAGQHIADSGNTGRSGTPHLHLELRLDGIQRCPQRLLAAIYHHDPIPDPATLPTSGCTF